MSALHIRHCHYCLQTTLSIQQRYKPRSCYEAICPTSTRTASTKQASPQTTASHSQQAYETPFAVHMDDSSRCSNSTDHIDTSPTQPEPASNIAKRRNIILLDGDCLESTTEHRLWVSSGLVLMASLSAVGGSQVHDLPSALGITSAALLGFVVADLLSGVYHWGVDNYGSGETPVFGSQIAGFQAHHQRPWTITERQFANNVYKVFKPAVPFLGLCLVASPVLPPWASVWLSSATFFTVLSQQFHAWSHMKSSELPFWVLGFQDAGLLISRKAHGAHHRAPFEGNYCIVSGIWNDWLDQGGSDNGVFRRLERVIHSVTGVEPRCWNEPLYELEGLENIDQNC